MTTLQKFARDMLAALETDQKPKWFKSHVGVCTNLSWCGLCGNLAAWCQYYQLDNIVLFNELKDKFRDKGLDLRYPFNKGRRDFNNEADAGRTFANPKRMAFLKDLAQ